MASRDDVGQWRFLVAFIGLRFTEGAAGLNRAYARVLVLGHEIVLWALQ